jgi:hypothetical protein
MRFTASNTSLTLGEHRSKSSINITARWLFFPRLKKIPYVNHELYCDIHQFCTITVHQDKLKSDHQLLFPDLTYPKAEAITPEKVARWVFAKQFSKKTVQ